MSNSLAPPSLLQATSCSPIDAGVDPRVDARWRAWALALVVVGVARILWIVPSAPFRLDFNHYYLAAQIALDGGNPYTTPLEPLCRAQGLEYLPMIPYGAHPPLIVGMFMGIAWLPIKAAYAIWLAAQCAAFVFLAAAVFRLLDLRWENPLHVGFVGLALNSNAFAHHFQYSQVQLLIGAVLAWATLMVCRGRYHAAVAMAAAIAAFKLYPVVLLPWFALVEHRGWKDVLQRSAIAAAVGGLAFAATGPTMWTDFVTYGMPVIENSIGPFVTNYTIASAVVAFDNALRDVAFGAPSSSLILTIGKSLGLAALALAYFVVGRRRLAPVAAVGVLTVGMILSSVVCWSHYYVLLLPAATLLVMRALQEPAGWRRWMPLTAVFLAFMPKTGGVVPTWESPLGRAALHAYLLLHFYPIAAAAVMAWLLAKPDARSRPAVAL